jgi:thiamine-phosphate pyrophosphorylase
MFMTTAKLARHAARLNDAMLSGRRPSFKLVSKKMQSTRNSRFALMLVTDDSGRDWAAAASMLPHGSVVMVRARQAAPRAALFESLRSFTHLRVLVADDPDLALQADGLHLPERRAHEATHWRARRPGWIITAAAHSLRAIIAARDVDAVLLSPIFPTQSHPDAPALGPLRAAFIAAASSVPVYAMGGVTAENGGLLAPAFSGIAAIGALFPPRGP